MTLLDILILIAIALIIGLIGSETWRSWLMLAASVVAVFWLQSVTPIRHLSFWLSVGTLLLTVLIWAVSRPQDTLQSDRREMLITGGVVAGLVALIGLIRYLPPQVCCLTPTPPPQFVVVALGVVLAAGVAALVWRFGAARRGWVLGLALLLVGLLLVLKFEPAGLAASALLRGLSQQAVDQASALDLRWLGFSYVAFRLLHVLLDWLNKRLPVLGLREFVVYVIFFPALVSGPIDRVERFVKDSRSTFRLGAADVLAGGQRIVLGLFKKFVLANSLALIALNSQNAAQVHQAGWTWLLLYAYAFRLFFDFSGYTDIAIGMGRLMGIRLPENFDSPYLKSNLTTFWNSWHITLAMWFRAYYFNPITRKLRSNPRQIPVELIIAFGQITTMLLIGLWHGVAWSFVTWGAWHGIGLFVHNRWANAMRARLRRLEERPALKHAYDVGAVLLTFHFVTLGWVWFALPTPALAGSVFMKLFGM